MTSSSSSSRDNPSTIDRRIDESINSRHRSTPRSTSRGHAAFRAFHTLSVCMYVVSDIRIIKNHTIY